METRRVLLSIQIPRMSHDVGHTHVYLGRVQAAPQQVHPWRHQPTTSKDLYRVLADKLVYSFTLKGRINKLNKTQIDSLLE